MAEHRYIVSIETETHEQAEQVMTERLNHDEDLGFDYRILGWNDAEEENA